MSIHTSLSWSCYIIQLCMYLSIVNDVMVKTVALVDVSDSSPCNIQKDWFSGYDAGNHMLYVSCGIPFRFRQFFLREIGGRERENDEKCEFSFIFSFVSVVCLVFLFILFSWKSALLWWYFPYTPIDCTVQIYTHNLNVPIWFCQRYKLMDYTTPERIVYLRKKPAWHRLN